MAGKFKVELHPRGAHGKFAPTLDKVKPPKRKSITGVTLDPRGRSTTDTLNRKRTAKGQRPGVKNAKLELMAELGVEQRRRLRSVLAKQVTKPQVLKVTNTPVDPSKSTAPPIAKKPKSTTKKQSPKVTAVGGASDKTLTTESPLTATKVKITRAPKTKVTISALGVHTDVQHDKNFKVETRPGHKYSVVHNGVTLVLNDHKTVMHFDGIPVNGVPDIHKDFSKVKTPELINTLAAAQKNATDGLAPTWRPKDHGEHDPSIVGRSKANPDVPNYMGMQIHHVDQWALHPAREIEDKLTKGLITSDQAKQLYLDTITPLKNKEEGTANYELKLRPKEQREFVILAGGLHQGGTPLYAANHPNFYDPDVDKFRPIGIPKEGEGSREWFEKKYRKQFWKEYAKTQVTKAAQELDKRVKRGDITAKEASALFAEAQVKAKAKELPW